MDTNEPLNRQIEDLEKEKDAWIINRTKRSRESGDRRGGERRAPTEHRRNADETTTLTRDTDFSRLRGGGRGTATRRGFP